MVWNRKIVNARGKGVNGNVLNILKGDEMQRLECDIK